MLLTAIWVAAADVAPGQTPADVPRFAGRLGAASGEAGGTVQDTTVLRGRVTDPQGYPIAGARVRLVDSDRLVTTDAIGAYRLPVPTGREALLRYTAPGYAMYELRLELDGTLDPVDVVLAATTYALPAVTVTARRGDELRNVPGAAATVSMPRLRARAPLSMMDALRTVPGVHTADEDPFGLNLNVGFRGLPPRRSARVLLLEDGVPILLAPYGDPSMHYAPPAEAIERIEVVKGSGQIVNGPQTVGGVVNFVTRGPPIGETIGVATVGAGGLGYRNADLFVGTGEEGEGVSLGYTFREGDGVRIEQHHRLHNLLASGIVSVADGQSLLLKAAHWREDSRISETGLTQEEFETDPFSLPFTINDRFNVQRTLGQVVHDLDAGAVRVTTNAYASRTERASWRQSGESEERIDEPEYAEDFNCAPGATSYLDCGNQGRPRTYTQLGIEPRVRVDLSQASGGLVVDLGVRGHYETARRRQFVGNRPSSREDDASLTRDNSIETTAVSGFVQGRWRVRRLEIAPGLRVERISQTVRNRFPGSEAAGRQSYTQLLPGTGVTLEAGGGTTLFVGVHRGFAPPRPADVYDPEPGQPLALVDPEVSWNWEIGARTEGRGVSGELTVFHLDFENLIIEAPADVGQRFVNAGRARHTGMEVSGRLSLAGLTGVPHDVRLEAAYTFVPVARLSADHPDDPTTGNRLPYAPEHLVSGSVTFAHRRGLSVGTSVEYTGSQFADEENTVAPSTDGQRGLLPSYAVVNPFASYRIQGTGLEARLSLRNAFDRTYITQRNEGIYTGMRRLARAELQWSF